MMRVSQPAAAGRRTSMLAKASTIALLGLVCIVGFVALHNFSAELPEPIAAIPQARHQLLESAMLKLEQQEVHNEVKLAADLQALVQDKSGSEVVSRKQLHEVSEKIATAVRASHNVMDVRKLQEVGSPKPCGPKRPPTNTPRRPPRPCVPTPPNNLGICKLCVVYRYPVTDANAPTACDPPNPANFLNILNIALVNQYPDLFGKIGDQTPNCTVGKPLGGQQQYAVNGKYCVGPFPPDYNPQVESALLKVTSEIQSKLTLAKLATPASSCNEATVQAATSVVVGKETQQLTVTFECDNVPEPTEAKTFAATCPV